MRKHRVIECVRARSHKIPSTRVIGMSHLMVSDISLCYLPIMPSARSTDSSRSLSTVSSPTSPLFPSLRIRLLSTASPVSFAAYHLLTLILSETRRLVREEISISKKKIVRTYSDSNPATPTATPTPSPTKKKANPLPNSTPKGKSARVDKLPSLPPRPAPAIVYRHPVPHPSELSPPRDGEPVTGYYVVVEGYATGIFFTW